MSKSCDHDDVSRIHFQGGSILNTSRANPTKKGEDLQRVVAALDQLGIGYLATIGGDDTMFAASQVAKQAGGRIRVCHVPKTIDNDLPLAGRDSDVRFRDRAPARQRAGAKSHGRLRAPPADGISSSSWAAPPAISLSASAKPPAQRLTLIPEEFSGPIHMATVCDILEGAIIKRTALWNRPDGVAIIAEGLLEHMPAAELEGIDGVRITHDSYGHLRLAEVDLAYILKTLVEQRFASRGASITIVHKNIGYELRSAAPVAFDCEYVRTWATAPSSFC